MRCVATIACAVALTGCSHLILRPTDTTGERAAKIATRAVLFVPTLMGSELGILMAETEENRRGCGVWKDCSALDAAMMGAAIGLSTRPPAPYIPPYPAGQVVAPPQAQCSSSVVGGQVYTRCY